MKQMERIFEKQVDSNISRLVRKAKEYSDQSYNESPCSLNGSVRTTGSIHNDMLNIGDFETAAKAMAKNVLRRLEQQTADWGLPENEDTNYAAPSDGAVRALRDAAEVRHQELLGTLQEKRREEEQMHAQLLREVLGGVDAKLRTDESELPADSAVQQEFLDQLRRIKNNIAVARNISSALEEKRRTIEGIEAKQRLPLPPVDAWLAGEPRDVLDAGDPEDRALLDATRWGTSTASACAATSRSASRRPAAAASSGRSCCRHG